MYLDENEVTYSNTAETFVFVPTEMPNVWQVSMVSKTFFDEDGEPCFEHCGFITCTSKEPEDLYDILRTVPGRKGNNHVT